ncbi:hypothetical protein GCM10010885_17920 [Alicyclobacillus cellulosilyticus]|uniref:Diacylglycerol kinase n=1 Tax=Alicyclobacillus cellulosilyticus TaxID=1003997 RepID=A0A917NLI8_9BACL|nr:diacylglycerol kinase [Alicyclobacillus cellulosilyticus]GGJ09262.1 hypothetical protein GCM10010885_17920 [Alicyclobacillus cellulosilyticus]
MSRRGARPRAGTAHTLRAAFRHAWTGVCETLASERNMRIHSAAAAAMFLFMLVVRPPLPDVVLVIATSAVVMGAEQLNTAVELLTDEVCAGEVTDWARRVKDAAAGAVLLTSGGAAAVGLYILAHAWPWHWRLFSAVHVFGAAASAVCLAGLGIVWVYVWRRKEKEATSWKKQDFDPGSQP